MLCTPGLHQDSAALLFMRPLLEASEMVPMYDPPTAKIRAWRAIDEKYRDADAIRVFAYELGLTLKKYCNIL